MGWMRMRWVLVRVLVALALMHGLAGPGLQAAYAQVATTTLADTIYHADGTPATGSVIVSWGSFTTMGGQSVPAGDETVTIGANGSFTVSLAPNAGADPIGSYYTAVYHLDDGSTEREYWVIPVSASAVKLSTVKSTVLPTSVAMQTVSKNYVDKAIAAAALGSLPQDASPYVVKTGDTMTGPLVLPGDPVSANQAADKHYVDVNVAGLTGGSNGKVSLNPTVTQVVIQPVGTDLETTRLNQVEYASQYATGGGNNGIANATSSSDCTSAAAAGLGCMVVAEPGLTSAEIPYPATWPTATYVDDRREGAHHENFFNPHNPVFAGNQVGHAINVQSTESAQTVYQQTGNNDPTSIGLEINHVGLAGGTNLFPENVESVSPYFKSTYSALSVTGSYYTIGQHVLNAEVTNCYAVGDCLIGAQFLNSMGGYRDSADEGTHPFDLQVREDTRVFQGTCSSGCTTGSQSVMVGSQTAGQTQGEGRFLINKNPSKVITQGLLTGGTGNGIFATASFSGTSFPVSTLFVTATLLPSQQNNIAPGTVNVQIATSGVPAGYSTNTAAAPSASGVACISDRAGGGPQDYEMATYSVVDGTHFQMTVAKPHGLQATIAIGGLCGYGIEQTVDTTIGIRQVFPVIGSTSSSSLIYASAQTAIVGVAGGTSAYQNLPLTILSAVRSNNVVTLNLSGSLPEDVNGTTMTVAGVSDSSYNGSFAVTTTSNTTLTYAETGANSTATGGTATLLTGGFVLYPMAEVVSVYDPATATVDGLFTLAPNTVAWATNDPVEQPHYWQVNIEGDTEFITQTTPRPSLVQSVGYDYVGNNASGLHGFQVTNSSPASNYLGNGGTHSYPDVAFYSAGIWKRMFEAQAGEQALFTVHCNSKGCNNWNSTYNLFELDSATGVDSVIYQPQLSNMTFVMKGTNYSFTPTAFNAGTANIRTLNVGSINVTSMAADPVTLAPATVGDVTANTLHGALDASYVATGTLTAARLPLMGASGVHHALGAVPDPGAAAGTTRFLREDGTWVAPAGGSGGGSSSGAGGPLPASLNAGLLADYNFYQQGGATLTDGSGNGNDGTLRTGSNAPTWTGTGLSFLPGEGVSLPATLNAGKSFVIEAYLNPLTSGDQVPDTYPVLVTNSLGGSGLGLLTDYALNAGTYAPTYAYAMSIFAGSAHQSSAANLFSGFHVLTYVLGTGSGNVDHLYIDGTEVASYQQQTASAGLQTSGNLYVGSSGTSPWDTSGLNGTAYRMRVYSTQLAASDVAAVTQAMVSEAGQRGVATAPVPVNLGAPQFNAVGDSITYGFLAASPWPSLMSLTNQPSYNVVDWGIVGISLQSINASEPNRVALRCKSSAGPSVAVVFAGTNDLASLAGSTPQSVFGYMQSEIQTLKQAGCKVFAGTMLSRTGTDQQGNSVDADKDAYDGLILSQAKLAGADGVIDFAADARLGADGANANSYFNPDHVHPTTAGQQILANEASNALNYYFGASAGSPKVVTALPYGMAAADGYVSLQGLTSAGALTLPDCTGQSGAVYQVNNPQSAYAVSIGALNSGQPINGLTSAVVVPANATVTLRDVPNAKTVGGCHWEM